jgi:uncharacterized membrane protein YqaE (UPF0057 family)
MRAMHIRLQLRLRALFAALAGLVLLFESVDAEFLRRGFQAWATMVNIFIFLFGAAFLLQSWLLFKQLQAARSK